MKRIYILLIVCISYYHNGFSQNNYEFEISEGFVFFDYFGDEPERYDKIFAGYGLQTEFDFWKNVYKYKGIQSRIGIGITNYYYLNEYSFSFIARDEISTAYLNVKLGIEYKPNWSSIYFLLRSTNYFLLHEKKQQYSQNKWFSNLDLGLKIKIIKNFNISIWSPVTLYPMHNGKFVSRPLNYDNDPWIEITGINLGISYGFGKINRN